MEMWSNPGISVINSGRALVTTNELYIIKKQETLNLHLIPTAKLKQRIEQLNDNELD